MNQAATCSISSSRASCKRNCCMDSRPELHGFWPWDWCCRRYMPFKNMNGAKRRCFSCRCPNAGTTVWEIGAIHRGAWGQRHWSSSGCLFHHAYPTGYRATKFMFGRTYEMTISLGTAGPIFQVASIRLLRANEQGWQNSSWIAETCSPSERMCLAWCLSFPAGTSAHISHASTF